ncbi:MAG: aconitase family protein, partial [Calditrichaceae bacterium]
VLTLEMNSIRPHVSGPNSVKIMKSITDIEKENININKAYLVSCVNSRVEDIAEAARVVKNKKVADGVEFYIAAASDEVQNESEQRGDWETLLDAGAIPLPPGCGPCIGLGAGLLKDGEIGISATNRNFKGRMGSKNAYAYLASPAVVAASAVAGKIKSPNHFDSVDVTGTIQTNNEGKIDYNRKVKILTGFPGHMGGELVFCYQDNLNTDGIYPGKYTYQDDITPEKQAQVVMENYDPQFVSITRKGDILAGGFNFGMGSSREQAATALKHRGLQMVIAGSFSETYKRNAINNGFLIIECPELINMLKSKFGNDKLTVRTGINITVDFEQSVINTGSKRYKFPVLGKAAQELIINGGLENWVRDKIE